MLARSRIYTNYRDEKCDYSVTGWRNVLTLMTQLIFVIAFSVYSAEKSKFTSQTLNVGINSPITENAYTETRKHLLLCLDREYK